MLILVQDIASNNENEHDKDYDIRSYLKNVDQGSPLWRGNPPHILADHGPLVRRRRIEIASIMQ